MAVCGMVGKTVTGYSMSTKALWKYAKLATPILIGAALLWFLLSLVDLRAVRESLLNVSVAKLVPFIIVLYSVHLVATYRWQCGLAFVGVHIPYRDLLRFFLANLPITKLLPLYSGDFVRSLYIKEHASLTRGSGIVLFESLLDVVVLLLLVFVGSLFSNRWEFAAVSVSVLAGAFTALFIVDRVRIPHRYLRPVYELIDTLGTLYRRPAFVLKIAGLTLLMWLGTLSFTYGAFLALGVSVTWSTVIMLQPLATLIALLPVSVGGAGTREAAMLVLYAGMIDAAAVVSAGLLYTLLAIIVLPLLCVPLSIHEMRKLTNKI